MKKVIFILLIILAGCEYNYCDCDYVVYENTPYTDGWVETYRSYWDVSCYDELLDKSVYTDFEGQKWYTEIYIECR